MRDGILQIRRRIKMGKIISQKLATKDSWIFSKSAHVFTIRKTNEKKKSEKVKPKEKK